ncbi:MAG: tetratricopeptide repeat protein [Gemmatimonadota bacterium]|jgi:tetratricopeptide (TPR) repeat protein
MRHAIPVTLALGCLLGLPPGASAQDIPEASPAAIAEHAEGLRLYLAEEWAEALPHFYEAHELEPTFYTPLFVAALSAGNATGMQAVSDSLWEIVSANRIRFSDYYQGLIDAYDARRAGNTIRSIELMRDVADAYPGTKSAYNYALWVWTRNPSEALRALATLDPQREPVKDWWGYWSVRASADHAVGQFEDELETFRTVEETFPPSIAARARQVRALAAMGRVEELDPFIAPCEAMEPDRGWHLGNILAEAGTELMAHGHPAEAKTFFERALAYYDGLPEEDAGSRAMRFQRAWVLYNLGRYAEARRGYEALARDVPNNFAYQGWVAVTAALTGDPDLAGSTAARFASGELGNTELNRESWQALIAVALDHPDEAMVHVRRLLPASSWMHRDPLMVDRLGDRPDFRAFLRSTKF